MKSLLSAAAIAIVLAGGAAIAQTQTPAATQDPAATQAPAAAPKGSASSASAPAAAPKGSASSATTTPPTTTQAAAPAAGDAAIEAKFKALDKDNGGTLEGAETAALKDVLAKVDTNKDGKVSKLEFAAAVKAGVVK